MKNRDKTLTFEQAAALHFIVVANKIITADTYKLEEKIDREQLLRDLRTLYEMSPNMDLNWQTPGGDSVLSCAAKIGFIFPTKAPHSFTDALLSRSSRSSSHGPQM